MGEKSKNIISNLIYHLKSTKKWNTKLFYAQIIYVFPTIIASFIGVYLPAFIVKGLSGLWTINCFMIQLLTLGFFFLISSVVSEGLYQFMYRNGMALTMYYDIQCFDKILDIPFEQLEDKKNKERKDNVWNVLRSEYGIRNAVVLFPDLMTSFCNVVVFGITMARKNIFMVIFCCVYLAFNMVSLKKLKNKHSVFHKQLSKLSAQTSYVSRETMNKAAAADLRIFNMQKWILDKYDQALCGIGNIYNRIHNAYFIRSILDGGFQFIVQCLVYGYLIHNVYKNKIDIAEFVFLSTIYRQFIESLKKMIEQFLSCIPVNTSIHYIREYLEQLSDIQTKSWKSVKHIREIEFRKVSFKYPGSNKDIICDINLNITKGEKIALLGLNGVGKTTLVKLFCGLYEPTKGEILINGIPIKNILPHDRQRLFSALFQDSIILPMEIDKNICGGDVKNSLHKFESALIASDFKEKYESFPQKEKTLLVKEVNRNAIDLSGGEKQKLLFARALYKDAEVIILDEPTSALDPISENVLYKQFAETTEGKIVFFISHRMASTKFCDRIVLLDNGKIIEEGTHDYLIKKQGKYCELYKAQSKYYQTNKEEQIYN